MLSHAVKKTISLGTTIKSLEALSCMKLHQKQRFSVFSQSCTISFNQKSELFQTHHYNLKHLVYLIKFNFHLASHNHGRYGHRLIKLWEEPEYTTKPLKVYRTGGRLPTTNWKGDIVPGKVWTAKLGGGLSREFHWVERTRLTAEEVEAKAMYQEKIIKIIEDDNRSGHLALVAGPFKRRWILCTQNMKVGDLITNCARQSVGGLIFNDGDAYPVYLIPIGTKVCFVEFRPGKGGQIARSAGNFCTVSKKLEGRVVLQMPSKREINIDEKCVAVIGAVSNPGHIKVPWGSASKTREYGIRPKSGRHHKRDGRFNSHSTALRPPIVIKDHKVLQKNTDFED